MVKEKRIKASLPSGTTPRTPVQNRLALKKKVRIFYDLQRLRLQTEGRTHKSAKEGEIILHPVDEEILENRTNELKRAEKAALRDVADHLMEIPFYVQVLSDKVRYRGIGPTMAGLILAEFDIVREEMPSQMWSFAGLAPIISDVKRCRWCSGLVENYVERSTGTHANIWQHKKGQTRRFGENQPAEEDTKKKSCPKSNMQLGLDDVFDSGHAMRPTRGEKLPYNAFLRAKLCGVLGPVLLKLGSPWRKFYDDYKNRKVNQQMAPGKIGWGISDLHRHNASIRYMIKQLLLDIWTRWRTFEKLPTRPSYQEQYLGHTHHTSPSTTTPQSKPGPTDLLDDQINAELESLEEFDNN